MAGIGFELRKAVYEKNNRKKLSGYVGAAFSSSGSMIIGIFLFVLIQFIANKQQIPQNIRDAFMCYVTTAMFISITVTSAFSLVLSRYVSNNIYLGNTENIRSSFLGGTVISSILGEIVFLLCMVLSKINGITFFLLFVLYAALSNCWVLMTYISLIRNYRYIVFAYLFSFVVSSVLLILLFYTTVLSLNLMILVLTVAFSIIDVYLYRALYLQFTNQSTFIYGFMEELITNPALVISGIFMSVGMLGHFVVVWYMSDKSIAVAKLFRFCPSYDFPAIVAFFSTIPSAIYFITLFETNFSEKYQQYFYSLINNMPLEKTYSIKQEMFTVLNKGFKGLATIQFVSCLAFITIVAKILSVLNIGMTEDMLDTFRMFCVGYSLYYIGNVLFLVNMYFMNEKNMSIDAFVFAVSILLGAFINETYLKTTKGIVFTIICSVFVILVGIQLVVFLRKLEMHIFCNEYTICDYKQPNKKIINTKSKMIFMVCLSGLILICSGSQILKDEINKSKILTFIPETTDELLKSPGMGLAPWAENEETMQMDTSLIYVELSWADWEPENNVFNVDYVKDYYNLDLYRSEGRNVVFRFICDEPTEEKHIDIPQWLYDETNGDGDWYNNSYGKGFSPNYSNPQIIEEHSEAIKALGTEFGKDDFFVYVELGSLGHWGEWHTDYNSGIKRMPSYDIRKKYIEPYINAFPNALFLIRYPLIDAVQYEMGLYNDMTGDYDETIYWLAQSKQGVWEQSNLNEQADCGNNWTKYPVGGEFASSHSDSYFMKEKFELTIEGIKESHQTFIGPKIIIDEGNEKFENQMNEILKNIGYRYRVNEVSLDFSDKETLEINCSVTNDGIAPLYLPYSLQLEILDNEQNIIWVTNDIDLNLSSVLPNEIGKFTVSASKEDFDDDIKYSLVISIIDDNGNAVVPMALKEKLDYNTYKIAEFYVK